MVVLISVLVFGLVLYVFFRVRYMHWKNLNVPYEKPTFFVGSIGALLLMRATLSSICCNLYRKYDQYRYVGFFNLWNPAIIVRDQAIINDILIRQYKSYRNWIQVKDEVDTSLSVNPFVVDGEKWKTIRSNLTSQFTSTKIKSMLPLILNVNEKMIDYIKKQANNNCATLDARNLTLRYTGENVYSCAFGLDGRSFSDDHPEAISIGKQISSSSTFVQIKQAISLFFPRLTKIIKCTFIGDPVCDTFKNMILASDKFRDDGTIVKNDYLEHVKKLKEKNVSYFNTEAYMVGHAFTFFLDGFETSSLTLTYALFELAVNPYIQEKAQQTIDGVFEKYDSITYEAFQELQYIEYIILETLRKYPIIKLISRVCIDDVIFPSPDPKIEGQEVVIKKGTQIFVPVQEFHRDTRFYSNPEVFNPDNFNNNSQNANAFLGFGNGPRLCLGKSFAMAQIKLGLTKILSNFTVELNETTKLPLVEENLHLFMSPASEIWLNFKARV